jgi:hypothetical protein
MIYQRCAAAPRRSSEHEEPGVAGRGAARDAGPATNETGEDQ